MMDDKLTLQMRDYSYRTVGPVVYAYAEWIVSEAVRRGLGRVYFLARDGYLPCEAARMICSARGIALECRYLYCSRSSLRMPTYSISRDEARRHLFSGGYRVSAQSILARAGFSDSQANEIFKRLNITEFEKTLDKAEQKHIFEVLDKDARFWEYVTDISKNAYGTAISYLREQGVLDLGAVAIADSGWTGSMQRSLRILLRSAGYEGHITGFYFGLYATPSDLLDGEYLAYYFDARRGFMRRTLFSNNLFECMLSAPHPTTVGYSFSQGNVTPVFGRPYPPDMLALIKAQISGAIAFCMEENKNSETKNVAESKRRCFKILRRAMILPTLSEARMYSHFLFCDDVSESYMLPLADADSPSDIRARLLLPRLLSKLSGRGASRGRDSFWIYGSIAFMRGFRKFWYLFNALLWDILRSLRDGMRRK